MILPHRTKTSIAEWNIHAHFAGYTLKILIQLWLAKILGAEFLLTHLFSIETGGS